MSNTKLRFHVGPGPIISPVRQGPCSVNPALSVTLDKIRSGSRNARMGAMEGPRNEGGGRTAQLTNDKLASAILMLLGVDF